MQAVFVQEGDAIDYTPNGAIVAGQVVIEADLVGVAKLPIAQDALGALHVSGVFDFAKDEGDTFTLGSVVWWDDSENVCTASDAYGDAILGHCVREAASEDTTVRVRLEQLNGIDT